MTFVTVQHSVTRW